MKTIVHVNQHVIKANAKLEDGVDPAPVLTCKTHKSNEYGFDAIVYHEGVEVGRFKYRPKHPLSCGAHVWFETNCDVEVDDMVPTTR